MWMGTHPGGLYKELDFPWLYPVNPGTLRKYISTYVLKVVTLISRVLLYIVFCEFQYYLSQNKSCKCDKKKQKKLSNPNISLTHSLTHFTNTKKITNTIFIPFQYISCFFFQFSLLLLFLFA